MSAAFPIGLLAGGAGIGAIGSGLAGIFGQQDDINVDDLQAAGFNASNDPVVAALQAEALLGLGIPPERILEQGSPLNRVRNSLGSTLGSQRGFDQNDIGRFNAALGEINRRLDRALAEGLSLNEAVDRASAGVPAQLKGTLNELALSGGFRSAEDMIRAEINFRANFNPERLRTIAADVAEGRQSALGTIAAIQQDFPVATASGIQRLENLERIRQANEFRQAEERILERAQAGGFNPARGLAELEKQRVSTDLDAVSRARQILGADIGLASSGIAGLQGSLQQATSNAQAIAGLTVPAGLQNASLASQQAIALAQLQTARDQFNAATTANAISGGANALGAGVSTIGALNFLANAGAFGNPGGPGSTPTGVSGTLDPVTGTPLIFNPNTASTTRDPITGIGLGRTF